MTDTNNPPAFPRDYVSGGHDGMTLRDYFAGQALTGLLAGRASNTFPDRTHMAVLSYAFADAMLKVRGE